MMTTQENAKDKLIMDLKQLLLDHKMDKVEAMAEKDAIIRKLKDDLENNRERELQAQKQALEAKAVDLTKGHQEHQQGLKLQQDLAEERERLERRLADERQMFEEERKQLLKEASNKTELAEKDRLELKEKSKHIYELEAQIIALKLEVNNRSRDNLLTQVSIKDTKVRELKLRLAEKDETIDSLNLTITRLKQQLEEKEHSVSDLEASLGEKNKSINDLVAQLESKGGRNNTQVTQYDLQNMQQALQRDMQMAQADRRIMDLEAQLSLLRGGMSNSALQLPAHVHPQQASAQAMEAVAAARNKYEVFAEFKDKQIIERDRYIAELEAKLATKLDLRKSEMTKENLEEMKDWLADHNLYQYLDTLVQRCIRSMDDLRSLDGDTLLFFGFNTLDKNRLLEKLHGASTVLAALRGSPAAVAAQAEGAAWLIANGFPTLVDAFAVLGIHTKADLKGVTRSLLESLKIRSEQISLFMLKVKSIDRVEPPLPAPAPVAPTAADAPVPVAAAAPPAPVAVHVRLKNEDAPNKKRQQLGEENQAVINFLAEQMSIHPDATEEDLDVLFGAHGLSQYVGIFKRAKCQVEDLVDLDDGTLNHFGLREVDKVKFYNMIDSEPLYGMKPEAMRRRDSECGMAPELIHLLRDSLLGRHVYDLAAAGVADIRTLKAVSQEMFDRMGFNQREQIRLYMILHDLEKLSS